MKRLILVIVFYFGFMVSFSKDEKTGIDFKNEGNEAFRVKDYAKALQLYEQALSLWGDEPKDTAMVYNMAVCAYQTNDFDKSLKLLDESIAMNYKKQTALQYKANIYQKTNNDEEYEKALQAALESSPDDPKIKGRLATVYLKEANVHYTEGAKILKSAADDVAAAKYKVTALAFSIIRSTPSVPMVPPSGTALTLASYLSFPSIPM